MADDAREEPEVPTQPAAHELRHRSTDRILVCDDDPEIVDLYQMLLADHGYTVRTAYSGSECLVQARAWLPHVIILDVLMPELGGLEVCQLLRGQQETAGIPIIFVSALVQDHDRVAGLNAGADDYMTKPFNLDELLARIITALRHASNRRADVLRRIREDEARDEAAQDEDDPEDDPDIDDEES